MGNPPIEENDGDSLVSARSQQVGPEFCLRNEKDAGLDFFDSSPDEEGMVHWYKKDLIRFREVSFCRLISGGSHRGYHDLGLRKLFFDPLQNRSGTEHFPHRCCVNPDRTFERRGLEKSHSLRQRLSKPSLDENAQKKVGTCENEKQRKQDIISQVDHIGAVIRTSDYQVADIRISEHQG